MSVTARDPRLSARDIFDRLERAMPLNRANFFVHAGLAFLYAVSGRMEDALRVGATLDRDGTRHARCQNLLGALYSSAGRPDDAKRAFASAIEADPRDPTGYMNLGAFEMRAGNPAGAARLFAEALTLDPGSQSARTALAEATRRVP